MRLSIVLLGSAVLFSAPALADSDAIQSATSAGPSEVSDHATVQDWDGNVLREGSNGWTCLPDHPGTSGTDPWCVDEAWLGFINAFVAGEKPEYSSVGVAYMLMGDTPVDNLEPGLSGCKEGAPETCVDGLGAHLMMLIPGEHGLDSYSADFKSGGPWIMWPDTPYQHLMVPVESWTK